MKEKVVWLRDPRNVVYDAGRFALLDELRCRAERLGAALGPGWSVHGSIARGDVSKTSDIDLIFLGDARSYTVELGLQRAGVEWTGREVVMATPNSTPKGHIHLDEMVTVTFPLLGFRPQEEAFYRFGGILPAEGLGRAGRVPGVNKKLLLIIPDDEGHVESSIIGREAQTARLLDVPAEVVRERVRVLARRDRVGRTGVYMREEVPEGSSFEETLKHFSDRDPAVRRAFGKRRGR
jgi:predicted nucleotidyltransferase